MDMALCSVKFRKRGFSSWSIAGGVRCSLPAQTGYAVRMDLSAFLKTVMKDKQTTALARGSGGLPVFAAPAMAALMEGACAAAVDPALPKGFSTVRTPWNSNLPRLLRWA